MGTIYKRGNLFWVQYFRNGKCFRESSGSIRKADAKRLLNAREGEIAKGGVPGVLFDKTTFEELAENFLRDYRINERKTLVKAERSVNHLTRFFKGMRAVDITTPRINMFIEKRMDEGVKNSTINRELAALKRMMNLGAKQTPPIVDRVPFIPMLKENNVRKGFFEHDEFLALHDVLPYYIKPIAMFGYKSGWRLEEILTLQWKQVDMTNQCARLESGETKNDDARVIYFDDELATMFEALWRRRRVSLSICKYVFVNKKGTSRIYRFDKAWKTACKRAGVEGRIFHDLRRTAVRNLIRAGVPEVTAMKISGHKTRSVFDRYNIVNDSDLRNAAKSYQSYLEGQSEMSNRHKMGTKRHNLGTICVFERKKG